MKSYFSKNLKYLKVKKGIKQKELAKIFDMRPVSIGRWEREEAFPSFDSLLKLADFFEVSLTELVELNLAEGEALRKTDDSKLLDLQTKFIEIQTELVELLKENRELRKELMQQKTKINL